MKSLSRKRPAQSGLSQHRSHIEYRAAFERIKVSARRRQGSSSGGGGSGSYHHLVQDHLASAGDPAGINLARPSFDPALRPASVQVAGDMAGKRLAAECFAGSSRAGCARRSRAHLRPLHISNPVNQLSYTCRLPGIEKLAKVSAKGTWRDKQAAQAWQNIYQSK